MSEKGMFSEVYEVLFGDSWKMWIGAIILSFFSICLFIIISPWGASGGVLNWGDNVIKPLVNETATEITKNRYAMLNIMIVIGALSSALMAKQFAVRIPPLGELVKGLIGGVLIGVGAIIGSSCTLGGFYSGWPAMSVGAFIFTIGLVIGTFVAVLYLMWEADKYPGISAGATKTFLGAANWQPIAGVIMFIVGLGFLFLFPTGPADILEGSMVMMGFTFFGLLIGFVLQRSRFCIVRALREPFMTGETSAAKAVMVGILFGLFGFVTIKLFGVFFPLSFTGTGTTGYAQSMFVFGNVWISGILGGIIFGIGMTIAGGCVVGSLWRAGEGQVKLWFSIIGMVIAMPLTNSFKTQFLEWTSGKANITDAIFLPDIFSDLLDGNLLFSYLGAVLFVLVALAIWYVIIKWNEKSGKLSRM